MQRARLAFTYPSDALATAIAGALAPETEADVPKTRSTLHHVACEVVVEIEAADLAALRAALNSYLRWVEAAERAARAAIS